MLGLKNRFEIRGNITAIFLNSRKYGRKETYIDTSDLPKAMGYGGTWYPQYDPSTGTFYVQGNICVDGRKTQIRLHRWLVGAVNSEQVDHIDHDTLNNRRRSNLRKASNSQNRQNITGAHSNNKTSGVRGVCWHKGSNCWIARVGLNGRKTLVGYFRDLSVAKAAVEQARATLMSYSAEARKGVLA